jgi:hypothetical protein
LQISIGFLLLLSLIQVLSINILILDNALANSTWNQNTEIDFLSGKVNNVTITSNGNLELRQHNRYFDDNFSDDSKISYKNNITVDTLKNKIKLTISNNEFFKTFGGIYSDNGYCIERTNENGYIILGDTELNYDSQSDIWLIKIDNNGNIIWNRTFSESKKDYGQSIKQTSDGGFIILGMVDWGTIPWLIKTNSIGVMEWDKKFDGEDNYYGKDVIQTSDGGFLIVGYWADNTSTRDTRHSKRGNSDIWLVKTSSNGTLEWNKTFGGIFYELGYSVQQTSDGGYIIVGYTRSFGAGQTDIWIIKTNEFGNMQWNKTIGGKDGDWGVKIQQTSDKGYIIAGETKSYGVSGVDIWLIKIDTNGNIQWNKTFGREFDDYVNYVQQTGDNGYIILGSSLSYYYDSDIWLIKTDNSGNMQWNEIYVGDNPDYAGSIQQSSDGGYIIVGSTESFGSGKSDIWLIKTNQYGKIKQSYQGEISSKNLIYNENITLIKSFGYETSIPLKTEIKVQFSQNNLNWYNSSGIIGEWDNLSNGENEINLLNLNWKKSTFYYRAYFLSKDINVSSPTLKKINVSLNQYLSYGEFESQPFQSKDKVTWMNLKWNKIKPKGTTIKFQIRSANKKSDLDSKLFLGPNGNKNNYYLSSGMSIWSEHNNDNWIQFKIVLSTKNNSVTPIITNVTIIYNYAPKLISQKVTPHNGNILDKFNFTITYMDKDNDSPIYIKTCIDGINYSMRAENILDINFTDGKIYWYSTILKAGNHTYQFFASDGEMNCSTSILNLKVDFGPLTHIIIEPSSSIITLNDFQIFAAIGFDIDNNILSISPYWDVNGGGRIDQFGNFTPLILGKWTIFANYNNVNGNTTIIVIDINEENVLNNKSKDNLDNDTDNDFIPDEWENEYNLNITDSSDAFLDPDMDNLTNLEEYLYNTNPRYSDSDFDGLSDGDEVKMYRTNPLDSDTDNDSYNDDFEIDKNTDPLNDEDYPMDEEKEKESKKYEIKIYLVLIVAIIIIFIFLILYIKQRKKKDEK